MKYDPKKIESKWQNIWEKSGINTAQDADAAHPSTGAQGKKYYCLDMFPYPSGSGLHVGHWRGYVLSDVAARIKKAQGYNVLHPMGWDAFGLPAENYAIEHGVHPRISTDQNIANIKKQLQQMGTCFDWSREIDTTDPDYYKFTQWIFLQMFERGLAYRSDLEVNWCEALGTVLANEEVIDGKSERGGHPVTKKKIPQWVLKITAYADRLIDDLDQLDWPEKVKTMQRNWIGRSEGSLIRFRVTSSEEAQRSSVEKQYIEVFTTRADTLFGCTYVVLAPEHPLLSGAQLAIGNQAEVEKYIKNSQAKTNVDRLEDTKEKTGVRLSGVTAINPINGAEIPVFVADYVLGDYGTGAVMAVPAHDERDWEFAQKFDLPIIETIVPNRIDANNPPVEGKKSIERKTVQAIVYNPKNKKYLVLKWTKHPWITFPMGGVEEGEDVVAAAQREVEEETGYTNLKYLKTLGGQVRAEYFAAHKDQNRVALTTAVVFELIDDTKKPVSDEEAAAYDLDWFTKKELVYPRVVHSELNDWLERWDAQNLAYTEDGILINSGEFSGLHSEEARSQITAQLAKDGLGELKTSYKLRDWIFSRQRYWGEPIPLVHCVDCEEKIQNEKVKTKNDGAPSAQLLEELHISIGEWENPGWIPVPEDQLPLELPTVEKYQPTGTGESPLAAITVFVETTCPRCGGPARRETNTMPQWAGSCWYYMAYAMKGVTSSEASKQNVTLSLPARRGGSKGSVEKPASLLRKEIQASLKHWMPVDLYVGGVEHAVLHLLYARFWHKVLYDIGVVDHTEPFMQLFNQGMIYLNGAKMSKSKGNVVSPDEMVDKYGADALRAYELFIAPPEQDAEWNSNGLSGVAKFLNKTWELTHSIAPQISTVSPEELLATSIEIPETELQAKTHQTIKKFNEAVAGFRYNTLVSTLMEYVNYLADHRETLAKYPQPLVICIQLLSPICPHIAEELWETLGFDSSLFSGEYDWPVHDEKYLVGDLVTISIQENGKLRGTIEIAPDSTEDEALAALGETKYAALLENHKKIVYVSGRIINIVR